MIWSAGPRAPPIYFRKCGDFVKESWQAIAMPPIRLRNSWKSSCPSELRSSFFIMRSRTPGSFWFFVKAASSVFMKVRNSVLESVQLLPSFPANFWKTAIRDSMHRSVSVGLDIFAMCSRDGRGVGVRRRRRWRRRRRRRQRQRRSELWAAGDGLPALCDPPRATAPDSRAPSRQSASASRSRSGLVRPARVAQRAAHPRRALFLPVGLEDLKGFPELEIRRSRLGRGVPLFMVLFRVRARSARSD